MSSDNFSSCSSVFYGYQYQFLFLGDYIANCLLVFAFMLTVCEQTNIWTYI